MRQLTAGDGYQASNERQLIFGLAQSKEVDELSVHWPSGREQMIDHPRIDALTRIVEPE